MQSDERIVLSVEKIAVSEVNCQLSTVNNFKILVEMVTLLNC